MSLCLSHHRFVTGIFVAETGLRSDVAVLLLSTALSVHNTDPPRATWLLRILFSRITHGWYGNICANHSMRPSFAKTAVRLTGLAASVLGAAHGRLYGVPLDLAVSRTCCVPDTEGDNVALPVV